MFSPFLCPFQTSLSLPGSPFNIRRASRGSHQLSHRNGRPRFTGADTKPLVLNTLLDAEVIRVELFFRVLAQLASEFWPFFLIWERVIHLILDTWHLSLIYFQILIFYIGTNYFFLSPIYFTYKYLCHSWIYIPMNEPNHKGPNPAI